MDISNNLNGRVLTAIIDFDLIVNTELGLIRFIRENFQDERAFNLEILNKSDSEILSLLFSRKNENPLSIISVDENLDSIDKLYESFFTSYEEEIINRSNSDSSIFGFAKLAADSGQNFGTTVFFGVKNDIQRKSLIDHFGNIRAVSKTEPGDVISKDIYYIKDYRFFTDVKLQDKVSKKKIYFSPRRYNLDYFENVINSLTSRNVFATFGKDYSKLESK